MLQTTPQTDPAALARRPAVSGPLAVATPTTRKLADASISVNTRRAYAGALRRVDAWRGTAPVDRRLCSPSTSARSSRRAARPQPPPSPSPPSRFRAKLAGQPDPAGERDRARVGRLPPHGRRPGPGPGQAPLRADGLAAILATAERPPH